MHCTNQAETGLQYRLQVVYPSPIYPGGLQIGMSRGMGSVKGIFLQLSEWSGYTKVTEWEAEYVGGT